jgi:CPA2 family monovalent cation:H+ antiporter-2
LVESGEGVRLIAELGVALLLFAIGLEFSWTRLRQLGVIAVGGGALQVTLTMLLFAAVGWRFGLPYQEALVIGGAVALSSTAVVLRVLVNRAELDSLHGRNALGILLLQDMAVVPLVLLVEALSGRQEAHPAMAFGTSLLEAGLFVAVLMLVIRTVLPRLAHLASSYRNRELPILLAITVFLLATWGSHALELSPILGAFVAGLLLAGGPFAEQIRADVAPLQAGFVTIFFASIGMLVEVPSGAGILWVVLLAAGVVAGKALVVAATVWLFRRRIGEAFATGLTLAQIGEFSFVLAELGYKGELLPPDTFQVLIASSLLTLLATPYLISVAQRVSQMGRMKAGKPQPGGEAVTEQQIIVVGFGPAGHAVVSELEAVGLPFAVLELNPHTVQVHRSRFSITLGDATQPEILEHVGLARARGLVVTIPDPEVVRLVIRQAKAIAPNVPVIARARQHHRAPDLLEAGADEVVDEEALTGGELAQQLYVQAGLGA